MSSIARFFTAFSLLALLGAGCFSSETVVVEDDMDLEDVLDMEDEDDAQDTVELAEGAYTIDTDSSTVTWVGRKIGGSHNGTISIAQGSLLVGEEVAGEVVIDMTSIVDLDLEDEGMNAQLVGHLESDAFFNVQEYPTATFMFTALEGQEGDENLLVTGELTMKDITEAVEFPAQLTMVDGGYRLLAAFELDRTKWDVRFGSQTLLGDAVEVIVDDMMTIGLDVMLTE